MAEYFGVNSAQANTQYEEIVQGLDELVNSTLLSDYYDRFSESPSKRSSQNGINRVPWVMSTTEWLQQSPPKGMAWEANPSEISWNMPQRSVTTKTLIGTVMHVWPNQGRSSFFDEARLTFNLQSGNIIPVYSKTDGWQPAGGVVNFYDFMQLVDAPKLTLGTVTAPPRANLVTIQYRSSIFPALTLLGMFDPSGIRFSDNVDNQINGWSADFIVYDTIPKMSTFNANPGVNPLLEIMQKYADINIVRR